MTRANDGWAASEATQTILKTIEGWSASLPQSAARISYPPIPPDDDYGLEVIVALQPQKPNGCPIEIGITRPEAGSTIYVFLDTWSRIAARAGLSVPSAKADNVGLFVEPVSMPAEKLLEICSAVTTGSAHLELGVWRRTLVSTSGWVDLPSGRFKMRGVGGYSPLLKLFGWKSCVEVRTLPYEAWF